MITAIIPTMCKPETYLLQYTLDQMKYCNFVEKIIIIDNSSDKRFDRTYTLNHKVVVYKPDGNIGVNPSWNMGLENTATNYYALINDDLLCHGEIFNRVERLLNDYPHYNIVTTALIGDIPIGVDTYTKICGEIMDKPVTCHDVDKFGWRGCIMFGRKETWVPIERLNIFYGDNFIYRMSDKKGYTNTVMAPMPILHNEFTTSHAISYTDKIFSGPNSDVVVNDEERIWLMEVSSKYGIDLSPEECDRKKLYQ